jgi:hypothetical protein
MAQISLEILICNIIRPNCLSDSDLNPSNSRGLKIDIQLSHKFRNHYKNSNTLNLTHLKLQLTIIKNNIMTKGKVIKVLGKEIKIITSIGTDDFISLTDIARHKNEDSTGLVISHWLSTKYTIEFMGLWEQLHNPDFNVTEFSNIKNEAGSNGFVLSNAVLIHQQLSQS